MTEKTLLLGHISAAYGIKGWVKIASYTHPAEQILTYKPWMLIRGEGNNSNQNSNQNGNHPRKVMESRVHGKGVVARFEHCETRNQAEELVGYEIRVEEDKLPELASGEYYWHQLQGLEVINLQGERLGKIDYLMATGARDVMVITSNGPGPDAKQRLVPFVEQEVVKQVDLNRGQIQVDWAIDWD